MTPNNSPVDPSKLVDLGERLERATGADREVDAAAWLALVPGTTRRQWGYTHTASGKWCEVDETRDETHRLVIVPAYTSSVDAALALVERVLPGWRVCVDTLNGASAGAFVEAPDSTYYDSRAPTPALAICKALVAALAARDAQPAAEIAQGQPSREAASPTERTGER